MGKHTRAIVRQVGQVGQVGVRAAQAIMGQVRQVRRVGQIGGNIPPLPPSKGEMRRASIHEQYYVGTGGSASRTGDYGTSLELVQRVIN